MRSCVQMVMRPLLQAARPTVELGLPPLTGVPPLDPEVEESLCAAVGSLLAYHGFQLDSDWLMGVSGAAFRLGWRTDLLCCPSALSVYDRNPFTALGRALGASFRSRSGQRFERALELVRKQLALGRPLLTSGLLGEAQWAVILGVSSLEYQPGRHYYDPPIPIVQLTVRLPDETEPRRVSLTAWSGCLPGRAQGPLWQPTPLVWIECPQPALDPAAVLREALCGAVRQGQ
ncbi:MAG: hypothetical protein HUU35_07615, partial [Armatimonadetes bacterium]|nr:hypothetical protein [Armatimonadota bacterium]